MRFVTVAVAAALVALSLAACGGEPVSSGPLGVGRDVFGDTCSACHGARGQGGTGPALTEVHLDFPSCADQIEWIRLGSERWKETYGDTFGARDRPIAGGMPSMEETFTAAQIAAVAVYERTEFADVPLEEAAADCGVVLPGAG